MVRDRARPAAGRPRRRRRWCAPGSPQAAVEGRVRTPADEAVAEAARRRRRASTTTGSLLARTVAARGPQRASAGGRCPPPCWPSWSATSSSCTASATRRRLGAAAPARAARPLRRAPTPDLARRAYRACYARCAASSGELAALTAPSAGARPGGSTCCGSRPRPRSRRSTRSPARTRPWPPRPSGSPTPRACGRPRTRGRTSARAPTTSDDGADALGRSARPAARSTPQRRTTPRSASRRRDPLGDGRARRRGRDLATYAAGVDADPRAARRGRGPARRAGAADPQVRRHRRRGAGLGRAGRAADGSLAGADDRIEALAAEERDALRDELAAAVAAAARPGARPPPGSPAAVTAELAALAMPRAGCGRVHRRTTPTRTACRSPGDGARPVGVPGQGSTTSRLALAAQPGRPAAPDRQGAPPAASSPASCSRSRWCSPGADPVPTLVFDEVDAGVGGRGGLEVGAGCAGSRAPRQVIVVTHLPQVAAFADRHLVVTKARRRARHRPRRAAWSTPSDRVRELARMLAGLADSERRRAPTPASCWRWRRRARRAGVISSGAVRRRRDSQVAHG